MARTRGGTMGEAVRRRIDALLDAAERGESSLVPPGEEGPQGAPAPRARADAAAFRTSSSAEGPGDGSTPRSGRSGSCGGLPRAIRTWRFCEASAAVAYGLPVTWGLLTHVWVTAGRGSHDKSVPGVIRRCVSRSRGPALARRASRDVVLEDRLRLSRGVSSSRNALAVVESGVLRLSQASAHQAVDYLRSAHRGRRGVRGAMRVAALADARAESGGESIARWTMLEAGFEPPELQVCIEDPGERGSASTSSGCFRRGPSSSERWTAGKRPSVPSSWVAAARYECCRTSACASLTSRRFAPRSCDLATTWRAHPVLLGSCLTRSAFRGDRATLTDPPPFTIRRAELMQLGGWRVRW